MDKRDKVVTRIKVAAVGLLLGSAAVGASFNSLLSARRTNEDANVQTIFPRPSECAENNFSFDDHSYYFTVPCRRALLRELQPTPQTPVPN